MLEISGKTTPSFDQLVENIRASGLVTSEELTKIVTVAEGNSDRLCRLLVADNFLTKFQLLALYEGRIGALRIGNYDILDRLGAGGMGTVFKARHRRMKRIVALKVLAGNLSGNELFVKRFQREVETIAALGHPNVVMAYDADEADVGHFLVMEFVNGHDLAACVEREGTFSIRQAVECVLQAARGLAYAHSQGIIHRDIKPHNLLRDESGVIKVTDLGLARLNPGADGVASDADVTMAGGVIGTADYMPPEQAIDSTTIDHRADIYSLGCTLHYLLSGKPPYTGPTIMAILLKHRDGEIPKLSSICSEAPPRLDQLFERMLAKKPEHRPQQMSEVIEELEIILNSLPQGVNHSADVATTELSPGVASFSDSTIDIASLSANTLEVINATGATTVLIVEPSRVQAAFIKNYLIEQGFSVVGIVPSGKAAIEAVHALQPKAVVSAMHLKDLTGVELAEQIRSQGQLSAPGFVLVTSEDGDGESAALGKLNRVRLLRKPFSSEQMKEVLRQVSGASEAIQATQVLDGVMSGPVRGGGRRHLRVLIADDSGTARINVRNVLEGLGFTQFLEVPDGAHAIAVAAREKFDLIVTDYNMPLMDGRALVSYLKQNPATSAIPIIMVTTESDPRVLDPVRKLGVVAIFDKVFSASLVGPTLDSLFG